MSSTNWSLQGFLDYFEFVHRDMHDQRFVWILGAGASVASGIPTAGQLVDTWLKELHTRSGTQSSIDTWSESELGIRTFEYVNRVSFYSQLYAERFGNFPEEGFAFLESIMSNKDPSPGYSILAKSLAQIPPRHNAVITTNFDNLVADALSIYTDTIPFVCGHESLAQFVRINMRRPVICKIHRDLLLEPKNDPRYLRRLSDDWGRALADLFKAYTPIFIGYGGNDDTLMDLIASLQPGEIKGQMLWCYYEDGPEPNEGIQKIIKSHNGICIPTPEFDLLMVLLGDRMGINLLDDEIHNRAKSRARRYRDRIRRLQHSNSKIVVDALANTFQRSGGWWKWHDRISKELTEKSKAESFSLALTECPNSPELHRSYAGFLNTLGRTREAEAFFEKAIEIDPDDATSIGHFAAFVAYTLMDEGRAERLYARAVSIESVDAYTVADYAIFLASIKKDLIAAESMFIRAMRANPRDTDNILNFAEFLFDNGRADEALAMAKTAQKIHAGDRSDLCNLANLFCGVLLCSLGRPNDAEQESLSESGHERVTLPNWNIENLAKFAKKTQSLPSVYASLINRLKKLPNQPRNLRVRTKRRNRVRKKK